MQFDDQLVRYFGTVDLGDVSPEALQSGSERLRIDFRLETDRPRQLAMWPLMHILGIAPDLNVAFGHRDDQKAARSFMDLMARSWDS